MTKNLHVWGSLALCLPLALLGACASGDKPQPVVAQRVFQAPGKPHVVVTSGNDGAAVVLEAKQALWVELSLSAYEVANNMDWAVTDLKPGVLTVVGSRFERTRRDLNPLQAEGATVWQLKAQAPGQLKLTFVMRRPYALGAAVRSVSFDVTVK